MKKFKGSAYQIIDSGKWRFGGNLIGDETNPIFTEIDSIDIYENKDETEEALKKYCADNNYALEIK